MLDDTSRNRFQEPSFKVSKPQLVGNLKIPGDPLTSDSFISTKTAVKLVNSLKLPSLTKSEQEPIKKENKDEKPTYRMSQIYKEPPKPRPKVTPRNKPPSKNTELFQKKKAFDKSPRKKNVGKSRPAVSKSVEGSPLVPGKLVPVYTYRHGRKLPVTSFRPFVPPPPKKEPKIIMSLESVLVGDLKLPFMVSNLK